jgi:molecular chaperone DnaJ
VAADFYKTLGVTKGASADEIKKAYRKLAREFHPDRNQGADKEQAEERFKEIQEAYSVLSDADKRKQYDSGGMFGFGGGEGGARFDPNMFRQGAGGGFGDILSDLFGRATGGGGPARQRGRDLETEVQLGFNQAIDGAEISVTVPIEAGCPTCNGSGAKPGTAPERCPKCDGRGVEIEGQGMFSMSQPCSRCRGRGAVIEDPCPTCRGAGLTQQNKRYRVKIPAGVKEGSRIRVQGKGEPGVNGGPAGDLYVVTHVAPSPVFKRKGGDLEVEVPITVVEAIQGATVEVPTLDGTKKIKIPAGTQDGSIQRLRGEGPSRLSAKGRGDIRYRIKIEVPKSLDKQQKAALDRFAEVMNGDPRSELLAQAREES